METSTYRKVSTMFETSTTSLLKGINTLVKQLVILIQQTAKTINKHLEDVYSIYWDDQNDESKMIDPEMKRKVRLCRDEILPDLNELCTDLVSVQKLVGIEREPLDLDVTDVKKIFDHVKQSINDTKEDVGVIDLCDSDEEIEDVLARHPPMIGRISHVKAEDLFEC